MGPPAAQRWAPSAQRLRGLEKVFEGVGWALLVAIKSLGSGTSTRGVSAVSSNWKQALPTSLVATAMLIIKTTQIPCQDVGSLMRAAPGTGAGS